MAHPACPRAASAQAAVPSHTSVPRNAMKVRHFTAGQKGDGPLALVIGVQQHTNLEVRSWHASRMSVRDYQIEIHVQVWPGRRRCYRLSAPTGWRGRGADASRSTASAPSWASRATLRRSGSVSQCDS